MENKLMIQLKIILIVRASLWNIQNISSLFTTANDIEGYKTCLQI